MNGIIYIRVTQYQKHLIKDLLEEHGIAFIYDEMHEEMLRLGRDLCYVSSNSPPLGGFTVTVRDVGDSEYRCTSEFVIYFQKMINGDIDSCDLDYKIEKDKIYLGRSELSILIHRNGEVLVKLPYSHTPIYKKE